MWQILGISDEVETCERCGKTNLKRTVVLTDGEGETYVGTECASRLMGRDSSYINRKAREVQYEADKERERAEWSTIMNAMHYRFLKLNVLMNGERSERRLRLGFEKVISQTGMTAETVIAHLSSRWGEERVAPLKEMC